MSAENAWRIAREAAALRLESFRHSILSEEAWNAVQISALILRETPMPPAFRAEVEAEVQRRAIADRAAMPGYMPRYFGVWSSTGVPIGIWEDPIIALEVLGEYRGGVTREMVDVTTFRSAVEAETEELRGMLAEALPLVEEREFLAETEYSYGSGWPEPSPAEWGISCGYQQTADAMPYQQFEEDVERHHRTNQEEDEGDGEFLTLANRIRALLSRLEAKGESHE